MALLYSSVVSGSQALLEDPNGSQWTAAFLVALARDAAWDFARRTKYIKKRSGVLAVNGTLPAGGWYDLPSDFLEEEGEWAVSWADSSGQIYPLQRATAEQLRWNWETLTGSQPWWWSIGDQGATSIRVTPFPAPPLTEFDTLQIYYTALPPAPDHATTPTNGPTGLPDTALPALEYYVTSRAHQRNGDTDNLTKAALYDGMYMAQVRDFLSRASRRWGGGGTTIPTRYL